MVHLNLFLIKKENLDSKLIQQLYHVKLFSLDYLNFFLIRIKKLCIQFVNEGQCT